jgi:hypothetical protein
LVGVCSFFLYLIITIVIYGVALVFKTLVSNIFRWNSLGDNRMVTNGCLTDLTVKYYRSVFFHPFPCPGLRLGFWFPLVRVHEGGLIVFVAGALDLCLTLGSC